jgi:hypothetical protein
MNAAQDTAQGLLNKSLAPIDSYQFGGLVFTPSYVHAGAIVFLIFLLILTMARLRRLYVNWSLSGAVKMLGLGFTLAVIIEGFLLLGGRTLLTEIIGWENAPKPIAKVLDAGREKLVDVLGVSEEIPQSVADEPPTIEKIIGEYQTLSPKDARELKGILCAP